MSRANSADGGRGRVRPPAGPARRGEGCMASTQDGDGISLDDGHQLLDTVLGSFVQGGALPEPGPPPPQGPPNFRGVLPRTRDLSDERVARLHGRTIADIWPDLASMFRAHAQRAWATGIDVEEVVAFRDSAGDHI